MIEQLFEGAAVAQRLLQLRNHFGGHVHAATAAFVRKGQNVNGVLVTPSAGEAAGTDARFTDLSERAFDSRPERLELAKEVLAESGGGGF